MGAIEHVLQIPCRILKPWTGEPLDSLTVPENDMMKTEVFMKFEEKSVKYTVGPASDLAQGEALKVEASDSGASEDIAIFHAEDGSFYALQDECTHEVASLSEGWIEGCEVECPIHASRFNLKTGKVLCLPAYVDARTYHVEVVDGMLELTF